LAIPLQEKSDAFDAAQHLFKKIQVEQNCQVMRIRSDHGREFKNSKFEEFCLSYGIKQELSSPITPQQNGVVERKNMGNSGDGSCDDPLKESRSTLLGGTS